jgi:hypothetical protein
LDHNQFMAPETWNLIVPATLSCSGWAWWLWRCK